MAILTKTALSTMLAAAMLAGSSFAFAADNNNNSGNNNSITDQEKTGSIRNDSATETPDQADIERCRMAPMDDPTCVGVPKE